MVILFEYGAYSESGRCRSARDGGASDTFQIGQGRAGTFVTIAGIVIVLLMLVGEIGGLFDMIKGIFGL